MRGLRSWSAAGVLAWVIAAPAGGVATAQTTFDQFSAGCYQACSNEAVAFLDEQQIDRACDRYCECSFDELRARLPPQQADLTDLDPTDPPTLKAINGARSICIQRILLPLAR